MRPPGYLKLVEKSRAACLAAVETYNRASSHYREETFSILMINAWELLLKARIVQANGGKLGSLYEMRPKKKTDGTTSRFKEPKLTRSGTPMTIGMERAYNLVAGYKINGVDKACIANLEALLEIRDCATHLTAADVLLRRSLSEISLAAVKNYVFAAQSWFNVSFSDLNIASIPISFCLDQREIEAVAKKQHSAVARFLAHVKASEASCHSPDSPYAFTVKVDFDLVKNKSEGAVKAIIVSESADITIGIEDDKVPTAFPWDYKTLTARISQRYSDFKQDSHYHTVRKLLETDKKLCFERRLDPSKKGSSLKRFYNPNILPHFDMHYKKRERTLFGPE